MTNWTLFSLLSTGHGICPGEEFYAISKETHHSVHCKLSSDYDRVIVLSDDDEKDVIYGIMYDKYIISRKKFKPRYGETYYIITGHMVNSYIAVEWKDSLEDFANYMSGNCFPAYIVNSVPSDDMYILLRKWQDKYFADSDGIPYDDIVGSIDPMYLTREKSIRKDMDKNEAENH